VKREHKSFIDKKVVLSAIVMHVQQIVIIRFCVSFFGTYKKLVLKGCVSYPSSTRFSADMIPLQIELIRE
jgi:hypothetical protein